MKEIKQLQKKSRFGLVVCFLLACFLFSEDVNAQHFPPLVEAQEAQNRLTSEITYLDFAYRNAVPGTPAYAQAEKKLDMFQLAKAHLDDVTVEDALSFTYVEYVRDPNGDPIVNLDELPAYEPQTSTTYGDNEFDDLVDLLKE